MSKKFNLKICLLLSAVFVLLVVNLSCKQDLDFPNKIYITQAKDSPLVSLKMDGGFGQTSLSVTTAYINSEDVRADLGVLDSVYLNQYNTIHHTEFKAVPESAISLSATAVSIPAGSAFSGAVNLNVKQWTGFNAAAQYVIPVKINNVSNGMQVVDGSDIILILLKTAINTQAAQNGNYPLAPFTNFGAKGSNYKTLTIEGRIKYTKNFIVYGNWRSDIFYGFNLQVLTFPNGGLNIRFPDASFMAPDGIGVGPLSLNTWYHFALVVNNDNIILYLNGKVMAQQKYVGLKIDDASISGYAGGTGLTISEFRIWSTARTTKQINDNMCIVDPKNPDLLGYWRFNEGAGNSSIDLTQKGNAAKSTTSVTWVTGVKCPE